MKVEQNNQMISKIGLALFVLDEAVFKRLEKNLVNLLYFCCTFI